MSALSTLEKLETAVFDEAQLASSETWQLLGSIPHRKLLGRFLVLVGATSPVHVPVTGRANAAGRTGDVAVRRGTRDPRITLPDMEPLQGSALLERRQATADAAVRKWNFGDQDGEETCWHHQKPGNTVRNIFEVSSTYKLISQGQMFGIVSI